MHPQTRLRYSVSRNGGGNEEGKSGIENQLCQEKKKSRILTYVILYYNSVNFKTIFSISAHILF